MTDRIIDEPAQTASTTRKAAIMKITAPIWSASSPVFQLHESLVQIHVISGRGFFVPARPSHPM